MGRAAPEIGPLRPTNFSIQIDQLPADTEVGRVAGRAALQFVQLDFQIEHPAMPFKVAFGGLV